ncbi:hypothetical protein [Phaeobacter italicus]|uniref:hypothetical protein n=1 Tax=Phaeobacter italicus TaxID=481446 RepID=UPI0024301154|nr:hypothetical protein [Phaeobacter italicus]MCI5101162.1 hypothetical protein [Phaeobacter italicus]
MFALFDSTDIKCVFIGPQAALYRNLRDMLDTNDATLNSVVDIDNLIALGRTAVLGYDYLFVDIDGLGGVSAVIDDLWDLRLRYPSITVILISAEFETDDFDMNRRNLGDVSLRDPVLYASLELALLEAPNNNSHWRRNVAGHRQSCIGKAPAARVHRA